MSDSKDGNYGAAKASQEFLRSAIECIMEGKLEQLKSDLQEYLKKNPQFTLAEIFTEYKSEGKTLLHIAASSGRDDVMDYVIDNIPSLSEVINMPDQRGFTPLIYAVIGSSSGILQRLLTLNAEVNAVNDDGAAAIHFAAGDGSVDKLKMLIDHKANLLLMSKSGSVLHWAASEGHGKAIGFLLEKGLDPNMSRLPNVPGESESSDDHPPVAPAVVLAAVSGTDIGVRALVEAGADVGHIIQGNNTVLHIAAENGLLTACKAIVASPLGAKLCSMETSDTNLAVHLAAMAGHREIVEILLDVSLPHLSSLLKDHDKNDTAGMIDKLMADGVTRMAAWTANHEAQKQKQLDEQNVQTATSALDNIEAAEPTDPPKCENDVKMADIAKSVGNERFKEKRYGEAIEYFAKAIKLHGNNHVYWSNRSAAYLGSGDARRALRDAEVCRRLNPTWAKGCSRLASARLALHMYEDAALAAFEGLKLDEKNEALKTLLNRAVKLGREEHQKKTAES